jgi:hypothetical protein
MAPKLEATPAGDLRLGNAASTSAVGNNPPQTFGSVLRRIIDPGLYQVTLGSLDLELWFAETPPGSRWPSLVKWKTSVEALLLRGKIFTIVPVFALLCQFNTPVLFE